MVAWRANARQGEALAAWKAALQVNFPPNRRGVRQGESLAAWKAALQVTRRADAGGGACTGTGARATNGSENAEV
ncbi:MAG TPA: hypothetical protein VH599_19660 [Ktedonobacterales bacterium]